MPSSRETVIQCQCSMIVASLSNCFPDLLMTLLILIASIVCFSANLINLFSELGASWLFGTSCAILDGMTMDPGSLSPITPPPGALTPLLTKVPLIPLQVAIGDRVWHITVVPDQATFFEVYDELEDPPYGFLLWESAVGLARLLVQQPQWVRGKRALELGAGVGLPGLVAASLGAEVWQTDHRSDILALTAINAQQNGATTIQRFMADWRRWTHTERYQLILGADILYDRSLHFYLEEIFHRNLAPDGRLLLADPGRPRRWNLW